MSLEYTLYGSIPVKQKKGLEAAFKKLLKGIDDAGFTARLSDGDLCIDSYTTSTWTAGRIDELLPAFAAKWASEPAALDFECGGDDDVMWVGPKGFDEDKAKLNALDLHIATLQQERAALAKKIGGR